MLYILLQSFKQAQVMPRSGQKIAEEMARDILYMMESRISAVKVGYINIIHT